MGRGFRPYRYFILCWIEKSCLIEEVQWCMTGYRINDEVNTVMIWSTSSAKVLQGIRDLWYSIAAFKDGQEDGMRLLEARTRSRIAENDEESKVSWKR